jgi:hypothetical protein
MTSLVKVSLGFVLGFLFLALIGEARNMQAKVNQMPDDIKYQIVDFDNIWPDNFFCVTFTNLGTGFSCPAYWTFEPSKTPLGPGKWVFHDELLDMPDANTSIRAIIR